MRGPFPNMIGNNPKASAFLTLLLGCGSPNERMGILPPHPTTNSGIPRGVPSGSWVAKRWYS
jgi:hypothetical protein